MRTIFEQLRYLPDHVLIREANRTSDPEWAIMIDYELQARYESIREELEAHAQENSF